jgi:hypothetical protein
MGHNDRPAPRAKQEDAMKFRVFVVAALMLMAAPAFAQKVYIDYDKEYDFDSPETFTWAKTSETSVEDANPLMHSRIVNAIEHYLTMGQLREVESDPDLYVTYHTSTKENLSLNTSSFGYGYPGGWYGGYYGGYGYGGMGMSSSSTTVSSYETGTLVVDAWDPKTEKLVWRGTATNMTVADNPDKMMKRIDKALSKIVKKWQNLKKKQAKAEAKAAGS